MLTGFLERQPSVGIFASVAGLGGSLLAWLQGASIVLGFAGALFGFLAGLYTFRIKKAHWDRINSNPP